MCNDVHFQCCTFNVALFLITSFYFNLGLYSAHLLYDNTKETFKHTFKLFNSAFCAYICKRVKKYKQSNITFNFEEVVYMLHFLKLIKFTVLFCFASSDQSEIFD